MLSPGGVSWITSSILIGVKLKLAIVRRKIWLWSIIKILIRILIDPIINCSIHWAFEISVLLPIILWLPRSASILMVHALLGRAHPFLLLNDIGLIIILSSPSVILTTFITFVTVASFIIYSWVTSIRSLIADLANIMIWFFHWILVRFLLFIGGLRSLNFYCSDLFFAGRGFC